MTIFVGTDFEKSLTDRTKSSGLDEPLHAEDSWTSQEAYSFMPMRSTDLEGLFKSLRHSNEKRLLSATEE